MLNQNLLLAGDDAYNLTRSLRFRSSVSAYLNRTFSASNRKTFTFNAWVKKAVVGSSTGAVLFCSTDNSTSTGWLHFNTGSYGSADTLTFEDQASSTVLVTTQVFRDPSAWYMITLSIDTTQATASNRAKLFVNGTQITAFSTATYPSQNADTNFNRTTSFIHTIGSQYTNNRFYDGYLAEVNFIDGQALTPSSFGETSTSTGVWIPKKYTGTYGTNGFYLKFTDNSSLSALGTDSSGNGNTWTVNNFSVTSTSSAYDSMKDVPTLTDTDTANYCTLNPLDNRGGNTTSDGNLKLGPTTGSSWKIQPATLAVSSGKWYFEAGQSAAANSNLFACGVVPVPTPINSYTNLPSSVASAEGWSFQLDTTSTLYFWYGYSGSAQYVTISTSFGTSDVAQIAVDIDSGKIWVGKNNTWYDSSGGTTGNPATGANPTASNISGTIVPFLGSYGTTAAGFANFGQRPFSYTPPTGFKALNTFNLPTPTIGATASSQANKYFDATTFTGNASTNVITNSGSMQPDMVWLKSRSNANNHTLYDALRGVNTLLYPNLTNAEATGTGQLTSFNSNGFTLGANENANDTNGESSVGWQWRASNATGVTNTAGSITSTVSANTTAGFSIVTYTGNGSGGATVGHGLGVAPAFYIVKQRTASSATSWYCYHSSIDATPQNYAIYLNLTNAKDPSSVFWNNTAPTSSVFSLGTSSGVNGSSGTYVAYCFAQIAGYSAFGSYTGNGSTDGPFVFTGFRPRFIMIKRTDSTANWRILDTARDTYNVEQYELYPNLSNAEGTFSSLDGLSNGFKIRNSDAAYNASGGTYIYMAFAESPFKYSLAR